jgi:hypothetical protein
MTKVELEAALARNPALSVDWKDNREPTPEPERAPNRTSRFERQHQGVFANHCLRKGYAYTWHRTDKPSTASPGTPDFIVGAHGKTHWIEFKLPGEKLSADQEDFATRLKSQAIVLQVVYSDEEAIKMVENIG